MNSAFVADTHPIVWFAAQPKRLSRRAARAFAAYQTGEATLFVPAPVVLETWFLRKNGRIRERASLDGWWNAIASPSLILEPMTGEDVIAAERLDWDHSDVFDRLIVVCARRLGMPLITADVAIAESELTQILW